ncbi:MAG: glycosyltransferase family 39 protein [Chitinophagaceae bacterium]|nr:MAG: glycosyltransferase family 39 protein [Chitinophagaceae bacterium]
MKDFFQKHHRPIFYATWFLLGLLQSIFTELQDDEAYYWVFSKYLDWGYFDHPPMTALLIKIGTTFLSGELAVRLIPLILNTATIYITEKLTERKSPFLFYAIVLSVAVLQISGFVAVPDIPLMFFTALFFLVYKNYLQKASWTNVLLLGFVAACLLYSKYHAVLILLFVVLSNLKLLRDAKIYIAGLFALLLFVPHLYWQYQHDWISIRYHLFESNVNPYRISYSTDYILGQLLIAGPIAGFFLWPASFLYRHKNLLEKALKFTAVGIFVFFFLSTFKGKVEPNWTSPAIVALIVLAHQFLLERDGWRRWLIKLLPITILLVIAFRFIMIVDVIPAEAIVERYHAWQGWPQEMKKRTKGLDIVFENNYQRASKYWFYTGQMTYSMNKLVSRRNNFNFWPVEDSILGKPVYVLDIYDLQRFEDSIQTPLYQVGYGFDSSYHSFAKIIFSTKEQTISSTDSLTINFTVNVPSYYRDYLLQHPEINPEIILAFFDNSQMLNYQKLPFTLQDVVRKNIRRFSLLPALPKGEYFMRLGVAADSGFYSHNSEKIKLVVK